MHILFVAAEFAPLVRNGGLADMAAALVHALRALGHDVRVVMPHYRSLRTTSAAQERPLAAAFLPVGERQEQLRVIHSYNNGVPLYQLDIPAAFERETIYGDIDDDRRFMLFARGVLALMLHLRDVEGWRIDVVHTTDWHSALVPNYLKTYYHYTFGGIASVHTIHDLAFQGVFNQFSLYLSGLSDGGMVESKVGLPGDSFNFTARGLLFADVISTISPTYSLEILRPEGGAGLHHLLQARHERLAGIVNGIDTIRYNPETDPYLAAGYTAHDVAGKHMCKAALQQEYSLDMDGARPLIGIIAPLTALHGADLLVLALPWLIAHTDAQVIVMGSGDAVIERRFAEQAMRTPERITVQSHMNEVSVQRLYAGCDMFLLPACPEPSGDKHLIALRYGAVPIVRAISSLNDTVREGHEGNGFRFHNHSEGELIDALHRCLTSFHDTNAWRQLQARGMAEDNSWAASAREYVALYDWARRLI